MATWTWCIDFTSVQVNIYMCKYLRIKHKSQVFKRMGRAKLKAHRAGRSLSGSPCVLQWEHIPACCSRMQVFLCYVCPLVSVYNTTLWYIQHSPVWAFPAGPHYSRMGSPPSHLLFRALGLKLTSKPCSRSSVFPLPFLSLPLCKCHTIPLSDCTGYTSPQMLLFFRIQEEIRIPRNLWEVP